MIYRNTHNQPRNAPIRLSFGDAVGVHLDKAPRVDAPAMSAIERVPRTDPRLMNARCDPPKPDEARVDFAQPTLRVIP